MATIADLCSRSCGWLDSGSQFPRSIALSSRVRLARNIPEQPFKRRLNKTAQRSLVRSLLATMPDRCAWDGSLVADLEELPVSERQALSERQLLSRELAFSRSPGGVIIRADERASVMINEEDHVRLQILRPGVDVVEACAEAVALDQALEGTLRWSCHPQFGYLTTCPTNLGTGMRISVMLHLIGLVETGHIKRVHAASKPLHLAVRGLFGEGSEAAGNLYQISNQHTLGVSEDDLVTTVEGQVNILCRYEQMAREALWEQRRVHVEDGVFRAWGLLSQARSLTTAEFLAHFSWLRLGCDLGLLTDLSATVLDDLFIRTQPAHMELRFADAGQARQRDQRRATIVREALRACKE